MCAEHIREPGAESPLPDLVEVKGLPGGDADYWLRMVEISERLPKKPH